MDLTPETLRSATFRDKLRGYHPDDVDEFLESVARGLEVLLARLRDATERARAAHPPQPQADPDEAVRTLALAQRTADLAVREAKLEAERLVKAAEDRAQRVVGAAEENAVHIAEEAQAELRADLEKLQAARDQLFGEVKTLGSWLEGERGRIRRALIEVADRVDSVKEASDAPSPKAVSVPTPPRQRARERAARPAPAREAVAREATPPRGQPRTPPPAAPAPRQPTPPGGQPAVRAERAPDVPRFEPAPIDRPARLAPLPPDPPEQEPRDAAVLRQAQRGMTADAPSADPAELDDDPYFAELRRAMHDKTPLGPRDDDWGSAESGVFPPQTGSSS